MNVGSRHRLSRKRAISFVVMLIAGVWFLAASTRPVRAVPTPAPDSMKTPTPGEFGPTVIDENGILRFSATPTLLLPSAKPESVSYRLPLIRQRGLTWLGEPTARGCTAASVAMILRYWNLESETNQTFSAQELIDRNTLQGQFNPNSGLSIENVADDLAFLGYELAILRGGDKESLLDALEEFGPIAVLCKLGWKPTGANHMSVVAAYNAESDRLIVYDPNLNQPLDIAWQTFDNIWGLDYSAAQDGSLRRAFFIIVPIETQPPSAR